MKPIASKNELRWLYGLAGVAGLLALALALYRLDAHALWLDETFSVHDAQRSLGDMLRMRSDRGSAVHPPLHSLVLKASMATCGPTPWCVRAPSAIAAAAAVPCLVLIAGRLFGWVAAVTGAWLWPTLPYLLKYAHQARGYTLLLLLTAVALLLGCRCLGWWRDRPANRRVAIGLGITVGSMVATHLLAGLFALGLAVWLAMTARRLELNTKRRLRLAAVVGAATALPFAVAAFTSIQADTAGRFASAAGPNDKVIELAAALVTLSTYGPAIPLLLVSAVFFAPGRTRWLALSWIGLGIAPLLPLLVRTPHHFVVLRYFMPSIVPIGLVACAGASALVAAPRVLFGPLSKRGPPGLWVGLGLLLALLPSRMIGTRHARDLRKRATAGSLEPWDEAVEWVDARGHSDDGLVAVPYRLLRHPLEFYRPAMPVHVDDVRSLEAWVREQHPPRVFVLWSHIDSRQREKVLNEVLGVMGRLRYRPVDNAVFGHRAIIVKMYER